MTGETGDRVLTALTTEHFVLQTAINGTISETSSRASLYLVTLSSSLVAMGFVAGSREVLLPFVATVLPAVFLLGVFTVLRLVDAALEITGYMAGISRIHGFYRTLGPEAERYFAPRFGRWPEVPVEAIPVFKLGTVVAHLTTNASMLAITNSFVAGAGVTLLVSNLSGGGIVPGLLAGAGTAALLIILFYRYQAWRYRGLKDVEATVPENGDIPGRNENHGIKNPPAKRNHHPRVRRAVR
jgi:hypothetical protein